MSTLPTPSATPADVTAATATRTSLKPRAKTIAAITIGNGLEFYEFTVYSFFATLIGHLYFPVSNALGSLMLSLATFGVGFLARPLGGILLGLYADRVGRKPAMIVTLVLMALGSAIFVVTPTYAEIGVAAPLLIVLGRLIQGFAIGGEVGASTSMLLEYANDHSRGYYGSWQMFSQALSILLGAGVGLLLSYGLSADALESWGWRIPFLLGILIIPVGIWIRRGLEETSTAKTTSPSHAPEPIGIRDLCTQHRRTVFTGVLITIGATSATYIVLHYLANYAVSVLHMPLTRGIWAAYLAALVQVLLATAAGRLSDRLGRRRTTAGACIAMVLLIYPAFAVLNAYQTLEVLLAAAVVLAVPLTFLCVPAVVLVTELFPRAIRATGLSVVYCIGVLVFGGFAQFFATWLVVLTGNHNAPAFYVIGCGLTTLIGLSMARETAGRPLE